MIPVPRLDVFSLLTAATAALLALALFFAALTLVLRARNALTARRWARREGAWTPLVLDCLAGDRTEPQVLDAVDPADYVPFADFLVRFARRLKGQELARIRALAAPVLDDVARLATRGAPELRARAVQTVGDLGSAAHIDALVAALDDPSPLVAMTAVRALAHRGRPEHIDAVAAQLPRFRAWSPGYLAATLAAFGPEAVPPLRYALADPREPVSSRIVAAEALHRLHDLASADVAARAVETETDADLVAACLRLLAAVGTAAQAPTVRRAAASPDAAVRAQACAALAALGGAADAPTLVAALNDPSPWVVLRAAQSLRTIPGADAALAAAAARHAGAPAGLALTE